MARRAFDRFKSGLKAYRDDERGMVLPFVGLMAIILVVVAGASIDYGRAVNSREVMANALDASALAVASKLSTSIMTDDEIGDLLEEVFEANLSALEYKDLAISNMEFDVDPDEGVVEVSSTISVPTYFISVGGIGPKTIPVGVSTEVNYSKFDVELALVLDVTGSMGGDMEALRNAAQGLVDTLIPEGTHQSDSKVRISMIPYSEGVNLGEYAHEVSNGSAGTQNCVTERMSDAQFTDDPFDWGAAVEGDDPAITTYFGGGSDNCAPTPQMEPLTAKRNVLTSAISKLVANGGTAGQTGIAWGWYSLSPNWVDVWPTESDPGSYSDSEILKFAVIMTDGDFNRQYNYVQVDETCASGRWEYQWVRTRWGWERQRVWVGEDCEPVYGWRRTNSSGYDGPSAVRARELCDGMKDTGIEVYTIYFDTGGSAFGEDLMEYCADGENNFYYADTQADLVNAFGNIAKKIQSIYLAK
ncbi:pilus assembly protein [Roseibium sp.]|uniref:pilus assembly protein n=1 Tax=Roseibium sp. TaxID=1936156 RepID=UPI003A9755EF